MDELPIVSRLGMTDGVITEILTLGNISSRFAGCYHVDNIPADVFRKKHFYVVVNIGNHFVALYRTPTFVFYFDPLARPMPASLSELLKKRLPDSVHLYFNTKKIQAFTSSHCGIFVCLFLLHLDKKDQLNLPKLEFHEHDLTQNNLLATNLLKNIMKKINT